MRALLLLLPAAAIAQPILTLPVDCNLGETCYVQSYVDADPGPGARDAACGPQSYDGHAGTDFALPSLAAMEEGVAVLAAAPGTVLRVRDGEADAGLDGMTEDRDCGNAVVLDHGSGWETQYCHMRRGSVAVAPGDTVARGDELGMIGLSGRTEFPHLHISLRRGGAIVDPVGGPCGREALFDPPLGVNGGGIVAAGVATRVPGYDEVKAGLSEEPLAPGTPLVAWILAHGTRPGDVLRARLVGPGRQGFDLEAELDRQQALTYRAMGRRGPDDGWPIGLYEGTAEHLRDGVMISSMPLSAEVE